MIVLLTGNNQLHKHKEIDSLLSSRGGSDSFLMLSFSEEESISNLEEVIRSEDLFGKPVFLKIYHSDIKALFDVLKNPLARFVNSKDICVIDTPSLTKPEKTFFEKYSAIIKDFSLIKKKESPLVFALTDALIKKDKKNAWILFQKLIETNVSAEEIHGAIWWQWKTLALISSKEKVLAKKSISPYVFSKSENATKLFSEKEVLKSLDELMTMFQESRRGISNLLHQLEIFILTH
jgi:DNA polymerase III delta subunit